MGINEEKYEGVDWIQLDQDRIQWRAIMNMVMRIQGP